MEERFWRVVTCRMVAKGISISTPSVFDTLLPVGFPIIFRERNTHTQRETERERERVEREMESYFFDLSWLE